MSEFDNSVSNQTTGGPAGRALMAIEMQAFRPEAPPVHLIAPFLTQLIAIRLGMPQTRNRRRAALDDVIAEYEAGTATQAPRTLPRISCRA